MLIIFLLPSKHNDATRYNIQQGKHQGVVGTDALTPLRGRSHQAVPSPSLAVIVRKVVDHHLFLDINPKNFTARTERKVWCDRGIMHEEDTMQEVVFQNCELFNHVLDELSLALFARLPMPLFKVPTHSRTINKRNPTLRVSQ